MSFPTLAIGDLLVKTPIIQGGMGVGISLAGLASAVAAAGGLGTIAAAGIGMEEPDFGSNFLAANIRAMRKEIRAAREKSDGPLGVNIMVALTNYADMVTTAIEEKVDAIISGAGLPLDLPSYLPEGARTKLVPIVSSARAAVILCKKWLSRFDRVPDAFVVEGPMAGGHLGFKRNELDEADFRLEKVVPEVIAGVAPFAEKVGHPIPVIAAGGVYTGADIAKFLKMGAAGVQMGTRFVATDECDADIAFKNSYVNAKEEDMVIIQSPVGLPGRAINNEFCASVAAGEKIPKVCPFHCIHSCNQKEAPYCIMTALMNAKKGRLKHGFAFAGANAFRVESIVPVAELMQTLEREYDEAMANPA